MLPVAADKCDDRQVTEALADHRLATARIGRDVARAWDAVATLGANCHERWCGTENEWFGNHDATKLSKLSSSAAVIDSITSDNVT